MKRLTAIAAIFAVVNLLSCTSNESKTASDAAVTTTSDEMNKTELEQLQTAIPVPSSPDQQVQATDSSPVNTPLPTAVDWDKKIIKTGVIKFEVTKFDEFNKDVRNKIRKYGAYVGQEDNTTLDDRKEVNLTIKVPVASFDGLMNELGTADSKQIERNIRTEDVTGQVVDTKSRLEAKKEMRLKYLDFLKQSKNMKEVLEVQAEINGIQEEIESAAGRIQYLSKNAAYSTIQLSFYEPLTGVTPAAPEENGFFQKTGEAFSRGAELVKGLLLVLISIWPLILVGLIGLLYWRRKKQVAPVGVKP